MTDPRCTSRRFQLLAWSIPDLIEGLRESHDLLAYLHTDLMSQDYTALPQDALSWLLHFAVATAKAFEACHPGEAERVFDLLNMLKARYLPGHTGFVHGLALEHEPRGDTWAEDAARWADKLLGLLELVETHALSTPRPSPQDARVSGPTLARWSDSALEGGHLVVVGGATRPLTMERLRAVTGAAQVSWLELDAKKSTRRLRSLAAKIRRRSLGAVFIIVPLASHEATDVLERAGRTSGVPICRAKGYGLGQLERAWTTSTRTGESPHRPG